MPRCPLSGTDPGIGKLLTDEIGFHPVIEKGGSAVEMEIIHRRRRQPTALETVGDRPVGTGILGFRGIQVPGIIGQTKPENPSVDRSLTAAGEGRGFQNQKSYPPRPGPNPRGSDRRERLPFEPGLPSGQSLQGSGP